MQLLERRLECARIAETLDRAPDSGAIVVVEGSPGVGKSSMVNWAIGAARERGFRVLCARGEQLERDGEFGIVRQWLLPVLRLHTVHPGWLSGAVGRAVHTLTAGLREQAQEQKATSYGVQDGLYCLLANLTDDGPLLAVLDDAHLADVASLRFLNFLAGRLAELPLVVLLTSRFRDPEGISELLLGLSNDRRTQRLRVSPLSAEATSAFVGAHVGSEVAKEVSGDFYVATAGNPLFLAALVDEFLRREAQLDPVVAGEVLRTAPQSVIDAVLLRLSRLTSGARSLAEAAAILGDGADLRLAEQMAGLSHAEATWAADALADADVLRRQDRLAFVQPIIGSAIDSLLSPHARCDAHLRAARLLRARWAADDRIAAHLLATEAVGESWTTDVLRRAAKEAINRGAPDSSVTYLRRATREVLDGQERVDVLLELASAESGVTQEAVEHARGALALVNGSASQASARRVDAVRLLIANLLLWERPQEAFDVLETAIRDLKASNDRELRLQLTADLAGLTAFYPSYSIDFGEQLDRLDTELSGATDAERRLLAILAYRKAQVLAPAEEAIALAERALAGGHLFAEQAGVSLFAAGMVLGLAGRCEEAEILFGRIIARSQRAGHRSGCAAAFANRGAQRFHRGALKDALADIEAALEASRGTRWSSLIHYAIAHLVWIEIETGELDSADRVLNEWDVAGVLEETHASTMLLTARGCLRLAQGRAHEALDDLDEVGRRESSWGRSVIFEWRSPGALAYHRLGERARAHELATLDVEIARVWGAPRQLGIALGTLGLLEADSSGIDRLQEAERLLGNSSARLEHARALVNLGGALRRASHPRRARTVLQAGLQQALQCGARALVDRARHEFAATGARRRRRAVLVSGEQPLTPAEYRIATMAAQGRSNPDIARTLFITRKTVEMHLSNAYRTLGIDSRAKLAGALADNGVSEDRL